ncbi:CRISPR-associated endonuclease Cas2 [Streptomyces lycii]|uniref:CRISPR-associated endonuclease Cas2 n=1 Tax=Streptomyces lycii TaxID=2654337 RepID=A0ABQ7FAI3_9ACTN|nr:CRISPR-associated endonuclease Cas2 [Streptomyces lycii]KAF4405595.1 CRISPR-associated endonuclease Cas2 [Streptomyces lycii]
MRTAPAATASSAEHFAKLCEGHGLRVQKSVFEIVASDVDLLKLLAEVEYIIDSDLDNVRVYRLPHDGLTQVRTLGVAQIQSHREDAIL